LKKTFEIDPNWRLRALEDEDGIAWLKSAIAESIATTEIVSSCEPMKY
jgi:hypothetical protein